MTGIWFDTCLRISNTLKVMHEVFGNRKISIARELTKTYEEIITSDLNNILNIIDKRKKSYNPLKGEIILIVDGYAKEDFNIETLSNNSGILIIDDGGWPPQIAGRIKSLNPRSWAIGMGIGIAHWQVWAEEFGKCFFL